VPRLAAPRRRAPAKGWSCGRHMATITSRSNRMRQARAVVTQSTTWALVRQRLLSFEVLCVPVAALLLAAAVLKGYEVATRPVGTRGPWTMLQVELEGLLGVLLLSGLYRRVAWGLATVAFAVFSVVSAFSWFTGQATCGCFGPVGVKPAHMLILDLFVLITLLALRPSPHSLPKPRLFLVRRVLLPAGAVAMGILGWVAMASYRPGTLAPDGSIVGDLRHVVLEPAQWLGRPLPLSRHVDIGPQLAKDVWTVLLYHHDCPECQASIRQLLGTGATAEIRAPLSKLALVELPPYGPAHPKASAVDLLGRLDASREWFLSTPQLIWLDGGHVVKVMDKDNVAGAFMSKTAPTPTARPPHAGPVQTPEFAHALGYVEPGSKHTAVVMVRNPLSRTLRIVRSQSECKCMGITAAPGLMVAGGTRDVELWFKAPGDAMAYSKRVLLMTDDPGAPAIMVRLTAQVGLPLSVEPAVVDLSTVPSVAVHRPSVVIRNHSTKPIRLLYATSAQPGCTATVPATAVPASGQIDLPLVVPDSAIPASAGSASIDVATDSRTQPSLRITVRLPQSVQRP